MQPDDIGISGDFSRGKGVDRCQTGKEEERGTNHPAIRAFLSCLNGSGGSGANFSAPVVHITRLKSVPKGIVGDSIVELGTGEFMSEKGKEGGVVGTRALHYVWTALLGRCSRVYGSGSLENRMPLFGHRAQMPFDRGSIALILAQTWGHPRKQRYPLCMYLSQHDPLFLNVDQRKFL